MNSELSRDDAAKTTRNTTKHGRYSRNPRVLAREISQTRDSRARIERHAVCHTQSQTESECLMNSPALSAWAEAGRKMKSERESRTAGRASSDPERKAAILTEFTG